MTPEAQRVAIAEACGWMKGRTLGKTHAEGDLWWRDGVMSSLPDYLNDLNAMAEAERWLKEQPDHQYSHTCIHGYDEYLRTHFGPRATAAQRAEAFLRTLGLWVE